MIGERRVVRPAAPPAWSEVLSLRAGVQIAVIGGLIGWLYFDQIVRMVRIWQSHMDWSHGFLIVPFSLYFLHTRRAALAQAAGRPNWWGLALIVLGVTGYAYAIYAKRGYPQPLSMLPVIAGSVLMMGGWPLLRVTAFPIGFLVLAMPPPEYLYRAVTQPLQQIAARVSEGILNLLPGVDILRNGIHMEAYRADGTVAAFTVAGACSGMRSLLAFVALGLAIGFLTPRPTWHRVVMAAVVFPVALFCNVIRVVLTGGFLIYGKSDLAQGTPHMVLGLVTFGLGMAIYFGILSVLDHLFVDDADPGGPRPSTMPEA